MAWLWEIHFLFRSQIPIFRSSGNADLAFCCCGKPLTETTRGVQGLLGLQIIQRILEGSRGRNLEAGSEADTAEERYRRPVTSSAPFLIQATPTCPGMRPPTVGWPFLHQLEIKKRLHRHALGPSWRRQPLIEVPSSQLCVDLC